MPYVIVLPNPPKQKGIDTYYGDDLVRWENKLYAATTFQRVQYAIDFVKEVRKAYSGNWQRAVVQRIEYQVTRVGGLIEVE